VVRGIQILSAVLAATLVLGCSTRNLREAQDSYSNAVEAESSITIHSRLSALSQYKIALATVNEVIAGDKEGLEKDGLLGVAYTLKAITLLKIADLETDRIVSGGGPSLDKPQIDEAKSTRQELLAFLRQVYPESGDPSISYGTRDRVVMRGLYGLYDYICGRAEPEPTKAVRWFKSAMRQLDEARRKAPANHDVQAVIAIYQLTVLAEWDWRAELTGNDSSLRSGPGGEELVEAWTQKTLCRTERFWRGERPRGAESERLTVFWERILISGIKPSKPTCEILRQSGELD
jgi:hypothetical protein